MSHLSFTTAQQLKAAGFPQPAPAPGQYWWHTEEGICFFQKADKIQHEYRIRFCTFGDRSSHSLVYLSSIDEFTYCPSAEDILRELSDMYYLSRFDDEWACVDSTDLEDDNAEYANSAAEACAAAWLAKQKQKSK